MKKVTVSFNLLTPSRGLLAMIVIALYCLGWSTTLMAQGDAGDNLFWEKFGQPGHFVMMRHALAPGTGDPDSFDVSDCSTQRNLDAAGRQQAGDTGALLTKNGVGSAAVYSSAWCRCLETARLLNLGAVNTLPALNSFFQSFERSAGQTAALREWLRQNLSNQSLPLILVTHQVNISALTGTYAGSGEMILVKLGEQDRIDVIARTMVAEN